MKHDPHIDRLDWPFRQRFFLECWLNMVHQYSLDSYRVRTMNPVNVLRELEICTRNHANDDDRKMIFQEAHQVLSEDVILKGSPFAPLVGELCHLLVDPTIQKKGGPKTELITCFRRELLSQIKDSYVDMAFDWLERELLMNDEVELATPLQEPCQNDLAKIRSVTDRLLSVMLDAGGSLESLFALYRYVLLRLRDPTGDAIRFERRLAALRKIVRAATSTFSAVFTVDGITHPAAFPERLGAVEFSADPPAVPVSPKNAAAVKAYLAPAGSRVYAVITLEGREDRHVAARAYHEINQVLDLVRFEYERGQIKLAEHCLIGKSEANSPYRQFPIPGVVPNPVSQMTPDVLPKFVTGVDELLSGDHVNAECRDRVLSAFRLYRIGADAKSFENKLVNWWTAVEFLVKGSHGGKIGKTVEDFLVPTLCLGYVRKQLGGLQKALATLDVQVVDPKDNSELIFRSMNVSAVYEVMRRSEASVLVEAQVCSNPYACLRVSEFAKTLNSLESVKSFVQKHEQRLRWQVQRIYRARCDIVHSAERVVSVSLLCANLEFYLKSLLTELLRQFAEIKTLSGPAEFFLRNGHAYQRLCEGLGQGDDAVLKEYLQ